MKSVDAEQSSYQVRKGVHPPSKNEKPRNRTGIGKRPMTQGKCDSELHQSQHQPIQMLTAEEGSTLAATLIQAHPDAKVWLGDDDTIIGVQSALLASGVQPP